MVNVVTKSRIGFSVAVVTVITIGGSATFWSLNASGRVVATACFTFAVAGVLCLTAGHCRPAEAGAWSLKDDTAAKQEDEGRGLRFLKHYTDWGMILVLSAGLLYLTSAFFRARPKPPQPKPQLAVTKPAVVFPPLKLQGLEFNGSKSLALIDGMTIGVGQSIGSVKLVEVGRDCVKVEMGGETRVLQLQY